MRTTIRIDDEIYRRAKRAAAGSGRTVGELIEDALRRALAETPSRSEVRDLPVFGGSGVVPGVDLTSNAAVRAVMDEDLDAMR